MKNKISLAKDIFNSIKTKNQKDERVEAEANRAFCRGYNALICIFVIATIINDTFTINISSTHMMITIGVISYIILLSFCKNVAIYDNDGAFGVFIWSIFTLPTAIIVILMDIPVFQNAPIILITFPIGIALALIMYFIANTIYKKAMTAD